MKRDRTEQKIAASIRKDDKTFKKNYTTGDSRPLFSF